MKTDQIIEYELHHDDMCVASASGKNALPEILHYYAMYSQDGPCEMYRVTRELIKIEVDE